MIVKPETPHGGGRAACRHVVNNTKGDGMKELLKGAKKADAVDLLDQRWPSLPLPVIRFIVEGTWEMGLTKAEKYLEAIDRLEL